MSPFEIDDLRLKQTLSRELVRLVESGEASPPDELLRRVPPTWSGADVASPSPQPIAPEEIYRSSCRSVVAVAKLFRCRRCDKRHASIASGFAIASSGLVVTNYHVVNDPDKEALGIMTLDGSVYPVKSVLRADPHSDLALLHAPAADLVPLPIGDEPPVGTAIYVLSHPAGRLFTFTAGIVSRYSSRRGGHGEHEHTDGNVSNAEPAFRLMTITADFGRGSSGAPVLDVHGAVVGVARQTKSVYYQPDDDTPGRLQLVLKHCVPARALWDLGLRPAGR